MRVNFFVMFPTATDAPTCRSPTSRAFRAPDAPGFDNALVRDFPNITNVDVSASIAQVQGVLDQVMRAVEFLFGFTLAAGLVVLFAAVTRHARGAGARVRGDARARRQRPAAARRCSAPSCSASARWPACWPRVAAIASAGRWRATCSSSAGTASPLVPLAGAVAGAVLALAAGWWGLREVLTRPVVETLRQAADV